MLYENIIFFVFQNIKLLFNYDYTTCFSILLFLKTVYKPLNKLK